MNFYDSEQKVQYRRLCRRIKESAEVRRAALAEMKNRGGRRNGYNRSA